MHWSRTGSLVDVGALLVLCAIFALGGWLTVRQAFHLRSSERLVAGSAAGFILFISFANLLARVFPLTTAFWLASLLVLALGVASGLVSRRRPWLPASDLRAWPSLVAVALIGVVFTLILRGLAIFDDHYHLPLVSVMAAGNIPPRFPLDPSQHLAYHYGLHVFAAGAMRVGGLFPWSAWDLARGVAIAASVVLGWVWTHRMTQSRPAALLGSMLLLLGGGARWLLLFLPAQVLNRIGSSLTPQASATATGPTLALELVRPWQVGGAGPIPYPFAYANGMFGSLGMAFGGSGALPAMTILLLLLLATRQRLNWPAVLTVGVIFGSLGLSAEHLFVIALGGVVCAMAVYSLARRRADTTIQASMLSQWGWVLGLAVILAVTQGGFLTETLRDYVARVLGQSYAIVQTDYQGFSLRWPPILFSGHLGPLSILNGGQLVVLLAEAGPALLLAPVAVAIVIARRRKRDIFIQGLLIGSIVSFLVPMVLEYGLEFDITRLTALALWVWLVLAFPFLWRRVHHSQVTLKAIAGIAYGITVFGGAILLGINLLAIGTPTTTTFLRYGEGKLARRLWNRLDPNAQILDRVPERAVTLFGRASRAMKDVYHRYPDWEALIADPDPVKVAQAGYSYIYLDRSWAESIAAAQGILTDRKCVQVVDTLTYRDGDYRYLLDVRQCGSPVASGQAGGVQRTQ